MREIDSGSVLSMTDETAADLLAELAEKHAAGRVAPIVGLLGMLALAGAVVVKASVSILVLIAVVAALVFIACTWRDDLRKTSIIGYDLDDDARRAYEGLVGSLRALNNAQRIWHVGAEADVYDRKRNAGASSVVQRSPTRTASGLPRFVRSNLDVPTLQVGRQQLYFFPDRLLVFDAHHVGAIPYRDLRVNRGVTRFIEDDVPPTDAHAVGSTWRYVNKSGGPDRRFNNNRQLPIMQYETVHFASDSGLNELLHVSRVGAGEALCTELQARRVAQPAHTPSRFAGGPSASPPRSPRRFR